jgi:hypothetical protein
VNLDRDSVAALVLCKERDESARLIAKSSTIVAARGGVATRGSKKKWTAPPSDAGPSGSPKFGRAAFLLLNARQQGGILDKKTGKLVSSGGVRPLA